MGTSNTRSVDKCIYKIHNIPVLNCWVTCYSNLSDIKQQQLLLLSVMILRVHQDQLSRDHLEAVMNPYSEGPWGYSYLKGFLFHAHTIVWMGRPNSWSLEQLRLLGFGLCLYLLSPCGLRSRVGPGQLDFSLGGSRLQIGMS